MEAEDPETSSAVHFPSALPSIHGGQSADIMSEAPASEHQNKVVFNLQDLQQSSAASAATPTLATPAATTPAAQPSKPAKEIHQLDVQ